MVWNPFAPSETTEKTIAGLTDREVEDASTLAPASENSGEGQPSSVPDEKKSEAFREGPQVFTELSDKKPGRSTYRRDTNQSITAGANESKTDTRVPSVDHSTGNTREAPLSIAEVEPTASPPKTFEQQATIEAENAQQQINSWLAEAGTMEELEEDDDDKRKKPLKLGVMMAPQNISNSTQNINFGAGLMSEIPFSKRLRLDVGIGYAQQSLTPGQTTKGGGLMSDFADSESARASLFAGNYINSTAELSFGQIEIPLNMKYSVVQKKTADFYVVSGLSNMFYVNQEKTTTYNTVAFGGNSFNSASQALTTNSISESPAGSDSQVDVGQLVNLGLGFEQNLKNGTSISFEPFYKFTLGDQTFANQRFAIGGINLRMNFQLKK